MWLKEMRPGAFAGDRHVPIDSVACYVPRGKGSFPSVLLMTTIPAVVAGVPRPVVITPPGPDGKVDDATLVAARLVGIKEVYKCGGAQGVAAVAYGTESVPKCLKIVGPGSPWVVAAKRQLSNLIDPGVPAGPSESLILADHTANGELAALDLLIESEHGLSGDQQPRRGRSRHRRPAETLGTDRSKTCRVFPGCTVRRPRRHRPDQGLRHRHRIRQRVRPRAPGNPRRRTHGNHDPHP
jgi:hypothetical protein